jgi:hypothetical protein
MQLDEFLRYIDDYNALDAERLFRHYRSDLVFENFGNRRAGAEAFAFLKGLHEVVADRLEPLNILVDGSRIAMEANGTITALRDLPDLPAGALRKGERVVVRMFAFYDTSGPLITHIRVAGWPPVAASP